jgi:hypothetical protein
MYRVRYGDAVSGYCRFANGVPQGSVSGPLLFIIFVNSLSVLLSALEPEGLNHHLLADDTSIWCTNRDIKKIESVIQRGLDIIMAWSIAYKMPVNLDKNEAILFTNYREDYNIPFIITLGGVVIELKKEVKLLGVMLDSALTFVPHVEKMKKSCAYRQNQLQSISSYGWGGHSRDNRAVYHAFVGTVLSYCGAAWAPLLSDTSMNILQRIQNRGARVITGLVKSTNIEALLFEANLVPLRVKYDVDCAIAVERARRMPEGDHLRISAYKPLPPSRLQKTGKCWQHVGDGCLKGAKCRIIKWSSSRLRY